MEGHAFLAFLEITGGALHITTGSTPWEKKRVGEYDQFKGAGVLSAEAVLSWSLAGLFVMGLVAAFWAADAADVLAADATEVCSQPRLPLVALVRQVFATVGKLQHLMHIFDYFCNIFHGF